MPVKMTLTYGSPPMSFETPVATEEELLAFANRAREAGGADILEALLPSNIGDPDTCLIANAMNFSCYVDGDTNEWWPTGEPRWAMYLSDHDVAEKIADALELEVEIFSPEVDAIIFLPLEIGNAARAFDEYKAFTDLAKDPNNYEN